MIASRILKKLLRISRIRNVIMNNSSLFSSGCANLAFLTLHCDKLAELREAESEKLSHENCIRQACVASANSATTLLTTVTCTILDVSHKYKKALEQIVGLYEELLMMQGENPNIWDTIIESRTEVEKMKAALTEISSYMTCVEKVVNSTTEAAFSAGADYLCTILCERLHSSQTEINKNIAEVKILEDVFLKLQEEAAKSINKEKTK